MMRAPAAMGARSETSRGLRRTATPPTAYLYASHVCQRVFVGPVHAGSHCDTQPLARGEISAETCPIQIDLLFFERMLHLRPVTAMPNQEAIWPSVESKSPATAFSERAPLRKLIAVIDADLLEAATKQPGDDLSALGGLLSHPYITTLRYADEGPPQGTPRIDHPLRAPAAVGWIEVGPEDETCRMFPVVSCNNTTIRETGIIGDFVPAAEYDDTSGAYENLEPAQAVARRRADAIAMCAAAASGAHVFITRRDYLHQVKWDLGHGVLAAQPEAALDLVALYLRAQGVFDWWRSVDGSALETINRGLFYAAGARALLPAWWRWRDAISQHVQQTAVVHEHHVDAERELLNLAAAPLTRLQRALEARDQVHRALNQPQHRDTAELVLANLDVALVMLMAAVDATARVAHRALGLKKAGSFSAGWQRSVWLTDVRKADGRLADAFDPDTTWNGAVLLVLSRLRNSVHGGPSTPLGIPTTVPGQHETLVEFLGINTAELAEVMGRLGGAERWGLRKVARDRVHFEPDALVENLFAAAIKVIDNSMAATPVERLKGVALTEELAQTPTLSPQQQAIRRLLAIAALPTR